MLDHEELIEKYIQKRTTTEELEEINRLLVEDEEFRKDLSFHLELQNAIKQEESRQLKLRLKSLELQKKSLKTFSTLWKIAAGFVIVFGLIWFSNQSTDYEKIYEANFQPYPNIAAPIVRGAETPEDAVEKAFQYYESQNYNKAAGAFEELYSKEKLDYANFYYGISLMASDQVKKAIEILKDPTWEIPDKYQAETDWYLALAYIKIKNKEKATSSLEKIVETDGSRSEQAKDILKKLR